MRKNNQININVNGKDEISKHNSSLTSSVRRYEVGLFIYNQSWLHISEKSAIRLRNYLTKAIREIKRRKKLNGE